MSTKIKSVLAAMAVMTLVISASAQPNGDRPRQSPEERAKFMVERMAGKLDLTDEQKQQIIELHKEMMPAPGERPQRVDRPERTEAKKGERPSKEETEAMKAERELKMEEHKAEMKARMDVHNARMKEILTADQYEKWQKELREMPRRQGEKPQARHGKHPHRDSQRRSNA